MDYQSDLVTLWSELGNLAQNNVNTINITTEEQLLKLDKVYHDIIEYVSKKNQTLNITEKKVSKRQSKIKYPPIPVGDLFANEPGFQEPTVALVRRTTRQASIVTMAKMQNIRESATISTTTLSDDIAPHGQPIGNSTVIGNKPCISGNIVECISPPMLSPENIDKTYIKTQTRDKTYALPANKKLGNILDKSIDIENVSTSNTVMKRDGKLFQTNDRKREKLEDIDINVDEQVSQHITRTKKRKIDEDNEVLRVPLEKQISTPLKPIETILTPHQIRENGAEKRKEMYLKHKADQKKNDELQIKAAKLREEYIKLNQEKMNKKAEEKRKKDEKLKEKDRILKEEQLKKQKQAELRKAEIITKKKLAEEAKLLKIQKEAKLEENELNKQGKNNTVHSKIKSSTSIQSFKIATLQKIKTKTVCNF